VPVVTAWRARDRRLPDLVLCSRALFHDDQASLMKDYLIDAALIMFILITSSVTGNLIADAIEGKIAMRIAIDLRDITK
jgi:hypothetical protein